MKLAGLPTVIQHQGAQDEPHNALRPLSLTMPFSFDRLSQPPEQAKVVKSAFDSETFDAVGTIHVDGLVGSATISPSGRDVALAS